MFLQSLRKKKTLKILVPVISLSVVFGLASGLAGGFAYEKLTQYLGSTEGLPFSERIIERERVIEKEYIPQTTQEQKVIDVVRNVSPSVVSIVISKDVPILEQFFTNPFEGIPGFPLQLQIPQLRQKGVEKKEVGGGSGFLVSPDGLVLTNKHVVQDLDAEYTVFTNDGKSYPAKVLAKDPFQDLAVLKIDEGQFVDSEGLFIQKQFPYATLGDSDTLKIGQTVIAIGNALGEFRNTISVGVISGLSRTITAAGGSFVETIEDVIQTDAAINKGNSGGPLLNLAGQVIGINTATVLQAQSLGFAIPANKAKKGIEQVKVLGKIVYASLGVRYVLVDSGALVTKGPQGESAVIEGSAAQIAGIQEGDIILEMNKEKITKENSLGKVIQKYNPGDLVTLTILREPAILKLGATLGERSE